MSITETRPAMYGPDANRASFPWAHGGGGENTASQGTMSIPTKQATDGPNATLVPLLKWGMREGWLIDEYVARNDVKPCPPRYKQPRATPLWNASLMGG